MKIITLGEFEENFGTIKIELSASKIRFINLKRLTIKIVKDNKIVYSQVPNKGNTENQALLLLHTYLGAQKTNHQTIKHAGQICEIENLIKQNSNKPYFLIKTRINKPITKSINSSITITNENISNLSNHHYVINLTPLKIPYINLENKCFMCFNETKTNILGDKESTVIINHNFNGNINCDSLSILKHGNITGNINIHKLSITDGAKLSGTVNFIDKQTTH